MVDWRAPVAEPFYRATGRSPMGLARRRHFATRGRQLLNIEDELFGEHALDLGGQADSGASAATNGAGARPADAASNGISGYGTLISALETARSGRLGDIVATIQGEQDEIIRAPLPGVLVVQGGPGTGKTVVALHRAAYLLYTHRFPLEDQGVLVVGPNRLFLAYIEQVLPSLGEAGVELAVLADLVDGVDVRGRDRARGRPDQGRRAHGRRAGQGGPRPEAAAAPRPAGAATACRPSPDLRALGRHRPRRTATVPPPQRRSALRRGRGGPGPRREQPVAARPRRGPDAAAQRTRGPRSAGVDVAGADPRRAAPRPVRLATPCSSWRASGDSTTPSSRPFTVPAPEGRRRGLDSGRRAAARRGTGPARSAGPVGGPTTTRSAPTATSSSTRPRTSHRCSYGCSPAGR